MGSLSEDFIAYHEAGHAVAAHWFDFPLEKITIEPDDVAAGRLRHSYGGDLEDLIIDSETRQRTLEGIVITALAGVAAQRRFRPDSVADYHGEDDNERAAESLDMLADDPNDEELRRAWLRLLELRTERLVSHRWSQIEWLATVLIREGTLTGEAAEEAIYDAALPIEHRGKRLSPEERRDILAPAAYQRATAKIGQGFGR